jgi:hypothetical protein
MKTMIMLMVTAGIFLFTEGYAQKQATQVSSKTEVTSVINAPVAKWDKTTQDFNDIPQSIPRVAEFKLTNEGNEPLLISSAQASCGCTNLNYSKDPLLPGKSTSLSVTYNAAVKGPFTKTVTVKTNAGDQPTILVVKGNVLEKTAEQKQ